MSEITAMDIRKREDIALIEKLPIVHRCLDDSFQCKSVLCIWHWIGKK